MSWFILFPIIFGASFILTMVGLGGGLIFSPLFILLGFPLRTAVSASLFLNSIAAISAAITYFRKKMVDLRIGVSLIVSSSLFAPVGAFTTSCVNIRMAAIFSFTGGQLGSRIMAEKLKGSTVRKIFDGVLLIFVLKLLQRVFVM